MGLGTILVLILGALAGGFVSGLSGFGTALVVLGIWLYVIPPELASPMVVACSVASQLLVLPRIWRQVQPKLVLPFLIPGLAGVPIGTALLASLNPGLLKLGIGMLLLGYAGFTGLRPARPPWGWGGRAADAAVGFAGGVLGGLAGLSGALLTVWASLRGWPKGPMRGLFTGFNLGIATLTLVAHAVAGLLTAEVLSALVVVMPGTLLGAWLGARAYGRLSDARFRQVVLVLMGISGAVLVIGVF